jgi:hypothetical protein
LGWGERERRERGEKERERERDKRLPSPLTLHAAAHTLGYIVRCDPVSTCILSADGWMVTFFPPAFHMSCHARVLEWVNSFKSVFKDDLHF